MKNVSIWYQQKPIPQLSIFCLIQGINNYPRINTYWSCIVQIGTNVSLLIWQVTCFCLRVKNVSLLARAGMNCRALLYIVVDRGFEFQSAQTKDYKIGICCFSAKHAALRRKHKDWLARNQDNASKWGKMTIRRLLFQRASTLKIQLNMLV